LKSEKIYSAPGRLDFLNTHQDYKGLPVVGIAINLRTFIKIKTINDDKIIVFSENIKEKDEININNIELINKKEWFGNYIRAALIALKKIGYNIKGVGIWINSRIPIGAGLGSSGALLVSIIGGLNDFFNLGLNLKEIAELSYIAEHDIMNISCGRLDQYTSAFGNILYINTKPPYDVEILKPFGGYFVVIDSKIRRRANDVLKIRQEEINEGLKIMGISEWEKVPLYIEKLNGKLKNRILYTIKAHKSTLFALKVIKNEKYSIEDIMNILEIDYNKAKDIFEKGKLSIIGEIMNYQHFLLSNLYEVSLPLIDNIVIDLIHSGALGAKISGAGLGGVVIALFDDYDKAINILKRYNGWLVEVDNGFKIH
jgi:galactokinase